MMRLRLASLVAIVAIVACGSLVLATTGASTVHGAKRAGAGAGSADVASAWRSWPVSLSPAPGEVALAQVSFPRAAAGQGISASSLQVAVSGPFGDDYLAVAVPRFATPSAPRALVLLVNRPSPLLDPASVRLTLSARRALGTPLVRKLADPFARPAAAPAPALCDLPLHGSPLSASELRPLHSRGQALSGFDALAAVAQAYDVVCGLASASSLEAAVRSTPASPVPSPGPPVGKLPGEGCQPAPGYACPETAGSASPAGAG
jgi:hypothetical protein